MIKKLGFILCSLFLSTLAQAEGQFAVGLGKPYGGTLGGTYSILNDKFKYYVGAGLLAYSSITGEQYGYSLGFDYQLGASKNSLGLSFGTIKASTVYGKNENYLGTSLNYAYYFSGFDQNSWIIGLSGSYGERKTSDRFYDKSVSESFIQLGYQF
jgi:hypothetical protein